MVRVLGKAYKNMMFNRDTHVEAKLLNRNIIGVDINEAALARCREKVAAESYRVLKKDKFCAILMGDTRQKGCMIPMSFDVMHIFEEAGFKLKELIIKEQHNCKATGYWKTNSVKYNFLLIAHEYLFVFRK